MRCRDERVTAFDREGDDAGEKLGTGDAPKKDPFRSFLTEQAVLQ